MNLLRQKLNIEPETGLDLHLGCDWLPSATAVVLREVARDIELRMVANAQIGLNNARAPGIQTTGARRPRQTKAPPPPPPKKKKKKKERKERRDSKANTWPLDLWYLVP